MFGAVRNPGLWGRQPVALTPTVVSERACTTEDRRHEPLGCYTGLSKLERVMSVVRTLPLSLLFSLMVAACGAPGAPAVSGVDLAATVDAAVNATVFARPSEPVAASLPTALPTVTPQPTLAVTLIPTQSPVPPTVPAQVGVSLATNCRTGPGLAYPRVFSLQPGQLADVKGRSTGNSYWFIANPDQSNDTCWIWGEYATVEGDVSSLPVLTPEPAPSPLVNFVMYRHGFSECGSTRVSLVVTNAGTVTFKSARVRIEDLTASNHVYGPNTLSDPFGDNPTSCPKDKSGSSLAPGATAYIVVPMDDFHAGNEAAAYVTLCTGDNATGSCITRGVFFRLPSN